MSDESVLLQETIGKIEEAVDTDDIEFVQMECIEELMAAGAGKEAIVPLLGIFERHPVSDFGIPGDITHFVEEFPDEDYYPLLMQSVERAPSVTTVWAVNRVLNLLKKPTERRSWLAVLQKALDRGDVASEVKEQIEDVLRYQSGKNN